MSRDLAGPPGTPSPVHPVAVPRPQGIGGYGITARILVGAALLADVAYGHATNGWQPAAWLLGLVAFPAATVALLWSRSRRVPAPLRATGPVGHAANVAVFLALYLTFWYAPAVGVLSDAALVFYGASMLLAALRRNAGCEVAAVSNAVLGRDDQVGCTLFWPADAADARRATHPGRGGTRPAPDR